MRTLLVAPAVCLMAIPLGAADIDGKRQATIQTPRGEQTMSFEFQADGENLTGTAGNQFVGDAPIQDGKIEGDEISFKQVLSRGDREITMTYSGKISGDEIEFTRTFGAGRGPVGGPGGGGRGRARTFTATRVE